MNASIAIYSGSMVIYWSSIVIGLGLAACLCLSLALFTANFACIGDDYHKGSKQPAGPEDRRAVFLCVAVTEPRPEPGGGVQ